VLCTRAEQAFEGRAHVLDVFRALGACVLNDVILVSFPEQQSHLIHAKRVNQEHEETHSLVRLLRDCRVEDLSDLVLGLFDLGHVRRQFVVVLVQGKLRLHVDHPFGQVVQFFLVHKLF